MKKITGLRKFLVLLLVLFAGIFVFSAYKTYVLWKQAAQEQDAFAQLAELVARPPAAPEGLPPETRTTETEAASPGHSAEPVSTEAPQRQPQSQYLPLYEMNADFFGWLRIQDTKIDYPVMFTPWDSEYYLRRDCYGEYSRSGTPFMDGGCDPEGCYYLIYGHHLSAGTMFTDLLKYADEDFARSHPIISLDTLYEHREYEVYAAFYSRIYADAEQGVFRYYDYLRLSDAETFQEFLQGVQNAALYDTGVSVAYGDELLTLSTCNYHTDDGRFALVAKRIK